MIVNRNELVEALKRVKPGLSNNEIIEQSMHFCFQDDVVRTYNDQISITCPFESGVEGAVSAAEFYELMEKMVAENVDLKRKEDELFVKCGKVRAMIKISSEIKLIDISLDKVKNWNPLPKNFLDAVKFCSFSASTNLADSEFTCLYVKGNLVMSCDTFRATRMKLKRRVLEEFLLPARVVSELVKYEVKEYYLSEGWIHFGDGKGTVFSCRSMTFEENRLKNVPSFFLVKGKKVSLPDAFKKIVDRAQTLTGQTFEQERSVTLSIDEGKIVCRGESDLGWVEEDIKTDYKGRALSIRVHPEFLIQILDHLQDVVVGENTLLFEGEDFSHVVMLQAEE